MGLGFTFVKFGGKENKATEGSRAEEPQRSVLSEGPPRCVLRLLLAQENQLRGLQSQLWTTAVPSSLLSHPSCPPPVLLLPRSLLAGERQTTERLSGRAADSCAHTHPQVPQQLQQTGAVVIVHLGAGCGASGWALPASPPPRGGGSSLPTTLTTPRVKFRVA